MPVALNTKLSQADMGALADLGNANLLPYVNGVNGSGDLWINNLNQWVYSGGKISEFSAYPGFNFYLVPDGVTDGVHNILNPQPAYSFDMTGKSWATEFNRLRGDLMGAFMGCNATSFYFYNFAGSNYNFQQGNMALPGAERFFLNPEIISSGPWVVSVNDPDVFPTRTGDDNQGRLLCSSTSRHCFRFIEFWGIDTDIAPCTLIQKIQFEAFNDAIALVPMTFGNDFKFTLRSGFVATIRFYITITLAGGPGALTASAGCTVVSQNPTVTSGGDPALDLILDVDLAVGDNVVTFSTNHDQKSNIGSIAFPPAIHSDALNFEGNDFNLIDNVILASGQGAKLKSPNYGGEYLFFIGTGSTIAKTTVQISDPTVKGVWVAKTPPIPGHNVFLDQDFTPFVGQVIDSAHDDAAKIAISPTLPDYGNGILASSMRQEAGVLGPREDLPPAVAALFPWEPISKFGIMKSSLSARPTPYPILRDTDFVPFNLGFDDSAESTNPVYLQGEVVNPGTLYIALAAIPNNAKKVKVRCVANGTLRKGWIGGRQTYGTALASTFTIYARKNAVPTTSTYDFKVDANEINIPSDGGPGYLAALLGQGLFLGIQNNSAAPIQFDIIVETPLTDPEPARKFFADANECFSYSLVSQQSSGTASELPAIMSEQQQTDSSIYKLSRRPIPHSGYCIFRIRATRLPTTDVNGWSSIPTAGAELRIVVGQNKFNDDGTVVFVPFKVSQDIIGAGDINTGGGDTNTGVGSLADPYTIIIPANASTTGDIAVFIPVLAGNELAYQCTSPVVFESWVNWQPIFYNKSMAAGNQYPYDGWPYLIPDEATFFPYALNFMNYFNVTLANYPAAMATVSFPMSVELYNDLERCLNL